jgi:hypothetical protein
MNMFKIVRGVLIEKRKKIDETVSIYECNNLLYKEKNEIVLLYCTDGESSIGITHYICNTHNCPEAMHSEFTFHIAFDISLKTGYWRWYQ